jgi:ElaB/YqjD/DUF883 family membrane-anchored ribosome-binding protein
MATEMPTGDQTREIQETIEGARHTIREAIDRGTERAVHFKDAALDRGRSAVSRIEHAIEERPLMVLGGVFAGGLLLGFLLSRR